MNTATPTATAHSTAPAATTTTVAPHELPDFDPMKAALEADNATTVDTPGAKQDATTPNPDKNAKPGEQGQPDGAAKDKKQDNPTSDTSAKPGEQGTESAFTKAQKERARQENVLKGFQREKEAFQQEKQRYEAELQGLKRELQQLKQQHAGPKTDNFGIDAETYEELAKQYREAGNDQMAKAALERADRLRRQQPAASEAQPQQQGEAWKTPEFQQKWNEATDQILAEQPELADPKHPVATAVTTLVNDPTWGAFFRARPDGVRAALEVAKLMQKSAQTDALQKELEAAKAEIGRLTKLTQPRGGNPAGQPSNDPKPVSEMTGDDIMAAAKAADSGG